MKEYFSHDYYSRSDYKIKMLLAETGMEGYGIYWSIIEDLYANNNIIPNNPELISKYLNASYSVVMAVINDFGLFQIKGENISCKAVDKRLELRNEKSQKAKDSASKRWLNNANAMRTHNERITGAMQEDSEGNAIKEKKIKEKNIKVNNSKEYNNKLTNIDIPFQNSVSFKNWSYDQFKTQIIEVYELGKIQMSKEDWKNFLDYWTEKTASGKFRFQLEKAWDTNLRISRWSKNQKPTKKEEVKDAISETFKKIINDEY